MKSPTTKNRTGMNAPTYIWDNFEPARENCNVSKLVLLLLLKLFNILDISITQMVYSFLGENFYSFLQRYQI